MECTLPHKDFSNSKIQFHSTVKISKIQAWVSVKYKAHTVIYLLLNALVLFLQGRLETTPLGQVSSYTLIHLAPDSSLTEQD